MLLGELGLDGSLLSHNSLRRSTSVCLGCQLGTCGTLVGCVAARFVTTARFVTKVTKCAVMPARFVTNEVVTNRAGIALLLFFFFLFLFSLGYQYMLYVSLVCVCVCVWGGGGVTVLVVRRWRLVVTLMRAIILRYVAHLRSSLVGSGPLLRRIFGGSMPA